MVMIILLLIVKTFFFLRIIESFTPIVIMLINVIYDLRIFLLFYGILLFMYSLLFSVIGIGLVDVQPAETEIGNGPDDVAGRRRLESRSLTGMTNTTRGGGGFIWGLRVPGGEKEPNDPNLNIPELF